MTSRQHIPGLLAALAIFAGASAARAQDDVNWYVIPSGGGAATDGVTRIDGTFGQAFAGDASVSTNTAAYCPSAIQLAPGFWGGSGTFCAADFNNDGVPNIDDIFIFLNAWFAGDTRTDANCSNTVNIDDIFVFLNLWFGGCP